MIVFGLFWRQDILEKVSIIIPTYNRKRLLSECLVSVKKQDYPNKEIIVIDDGSTDSTAAGLKENFPEIRIIRNEISFGPAFAKNQGIFESRGEYILFLDSDSELIGADTISRMAALMSQNQDIGSVGGIAERDMAGEVKNVYAKNVSIGGNSYACILERASAVDFESRVKQCDFLETCNCFTRTENLRKIGGFDPNYIYMGEDKELGIRLKQLGFKNVFGFKSAALHKYDESVKYDRRFMYFKSKAKYVIKNKGICNFLLLPFIDFLLYIIYYPVLYLLNQIFPPIGAGKIFNNKANPNVRIPPVRWLILAPYYYLKAYLMNLIEIPKILRSRNEYFLSAESMQKFKIKVSRNK